MRRFISTLVIAASALSIPSFAAADQSTATTTEHHRRVKRVRVYDPYRHQYLYWNRQEQTAYREYLTERHQAYVSYQRQRAAEQRAYWRWRHAREERMERER